MKLGGGSGGARGAVVFDFSDLFEEQTLLFGFVCMCFCQGGKKMKLCSAGRE